MIKPFVGMFLPKSLKCPVASCDGYLLLSGVFLCSCNVHSLCDLRASEDEGWEWLSLRVEGVRLTSLNKGCWQRLKRRTWRPRIARLRAAGWTGLVCSGCLARSSFAPFVLLNGPPTPSLLFILTPPPPPAWRCWSELWMFACWPLGVPPSACVGHYCRPAMQCPWTRAHCITTATSRALAVVVVVSFNVAILSPVLLFDIWIIKRNSFWHFWVKRAEVMHVTGHILFIKAKLSFVYFSRSHF